MGEACERQVEMKQEMDSRRLRCRTGDEPLSQQALQAALVGWLALMLWRRRVAGHPPAEFGHGILLGLGQVRWKIKPRPTPWHPTCATPFASAVT
jgi:hypothetical protein